MTRPRRILFVEQNCDGTIGGSHHSLLLLVKNLDKARYDPVVAFYQDNSIVDEFARVSQVVILPSAKTATFAREWRTAGKVGALLATIAQKTINLVKARWSEIQRLVIVTLRIRPDLIHLNNSVGSAGIEWFIAARLSGAKWITHQRGYGSPVPAAMRLDGVICISESVRDALLAQAPTLRDRTIQIYNGICVEEFARNAVGHDLVTARRNLGAGPDDVIIGLVGNFQPWKGQNVLLQALPLLTSEISWRCVLIGATPTGRVNQEFREQLDQLISDLGLESRVTFTGYRVDVPALVNSIDVLVHTSVLPEPMGRVILEGMALGKTVVATDHGGPREIIESGTSGFLVPPGDDRALAACLDRVIGNPQLRERIGSAAKRRVAARFTTHEYARRAQDVYASLWEGSATVVAQPNSE
jgi:glycosyltransferase involved in cell wall biosynthesis